MKALALRQLHRDREAAGDSGAPRSSGADPDADHGLNATDDHAMLRHNGLLGSDKRIAGTLQNTEEYQEKLSRMEGGSAAARDRGTPDQRSWAHRLASANVSWGGVRDQRRGGRGARGDGATLAEFCRDLVAEARSGRLDLVRAFHVVPGDPLLAICVVSGLTVHVPGNTNPLPSLCCVA